MRATVLVFLVSTVSVLSAGESSLRGTLTPAAKVKRVALLDRAQRQEMTPKEVRVAEVAGTFDAKTGAFLFKGLKRDVSYDLFVQLRDGTRIGGVELTPKVADEASFTDNGRVTIEKHFYGMRQFCNENRILKMVGNGKSAAVLVELCRTKEFNSGKGDVIWRVERWDYVQQFGAWRLDSTKVLRRFRLNKREWAAWRWYFVPAWGGLHAGMDPLKLELPDLSRMPGRYPGVERPDGVGKADRKVRKQHEEVLEVDPDL